MRIGTLRHRMSLQRLTLIVDDSNGHTESWVTVATVWGDLKPTSDAHTLASDQDRQNTHVIRLRYSQDNPALPGMRLVEGSRIFSIHAVVDPDEGKRWTDVYAQEAGQLD